ncbi:uncharacterized protein LOC134536112 [Bacillus rossius redtenbacheri]|uniref:uncharacterized protein LOC134536112 n=1 Tax=Bacillus rossius redtenbacheri TaxID=93214 RepID=UPI002FDE2570
MAPGELLRGQVVAPVAPDADSKEPRGWIMFRNQGNAFFAAFRQQDVQGGMALSPGDHVEFRRPHGAPCVAEVRLVGRAITCLGIVSCVRLGPASQTFEAGRIRYVSSNERHSEVEYGPRAQTRQHSLLAGDQVWFSLAVDRRTQRHCAVHVELCADSVPRPGERRERARVLLLKDDYGLVRCAAGRTLFFAAEELLDLDKQLQVNDEVEYTPAPQGAGECATRLRLLGPAAAPAAPGLGHVAALQESLGFIEPLSLDHDVLFSPRELEGDPRLLRLGAPVEYEATSRGSSRNLLAARAVRLLPAGGVALPEMLAGVRRGTVVRPLRYFDPHQVSYAGIIQESTEDTAKAGQLFKFGIYSLQNIEDVLLPGMNVTFQVDAEGHAANVKPAVGRLRGQVVFARSWYGYLRSDAVPGKLVSFLRSEVRDGSDLLPGDWVEYRLACDPHSGRFAAREVSRCEEDDPSPPDSTGGGDDTRDQEETNPLEPDVLDEGIQKSESMFSGVAKEESVRCNEIRSNMSHSDCYEDSRLNDTALPDDACSKNIKLHLSDRIQRDTNTLENGVSKRETTPADQKYSDGVNFEGAENKIHKCDHNGTENGVQHADETQRSTQKRTDANASHTRRGRRKNAASRASYKSLVSHPDKTTDRVVVIRQPRGPGTSLGFATGRQK